MIRRCLSLALAALHAANGVFILVDPRAWLSFVIGRAVEQAPAGAHFMVDVGLAFIASAIGFVIFALRPQQWGAALAGNCFPLLHAGFHVAALVQGSSGARLEFELFGIMAPALLGVMVVWRRGTT